MMAEMLEDDIYKLYVLACLCDQESQKYANPVVVIPKKKKRSMRRRPTTSFHKPDPWSSSSSYHGVAVGFNMKVSAAVLGKRCPFSHGEEDTYLKKKRNSSVQQNEFDADHIKTMNGSGSDGGLYVLAYLCALESKKSNKKRSLTLMTPKSFQKPLPSTSPVQTQFLPKIFDDDDDDHINAIAMGGSGSGSEQGLQLLAYACSLESETSEHPLVLVPTNFPKKKRSLTLKRPNNFHKPQSPSTLVQTTDLEFGSHLKVSATVLGKRCFFQQVDDADQLNYRSKKQRKVTTKQQGLNLQTTQLPRKFLDHIKALGGSDVKFLIEKKLTKTDLKQQNSRMSMPLTHIRSEFLTKDEKECLTIKKGKRLLGIDVLLWDPFLDHGTKLCLKKWDYNNNSSSYMLIENWNYVADKNDLRADMMVQMWSFRVNSRLCFALVY